MSSNRTILFYFKVPFTDNRCSFKFGENLTISEFLEQVNKDIRNILNISSRYYIELVETNSDKAEYGVAIQPRSDQTLEVRYGNLNMPIAFYARPVDPNTREYVRQSDYSL